MAPSWGSWGHLGSKLEGLGSKLGHFGSKFGIKLALKLHFAHNIKNIEKSMIFIVFSMFFWGVGESKLGVLGAMLRHLRASWGYVEAILKHLEAMLAPT